MLTKEDNQLLTSTQPNSGMGAYFRRFWQPILLSKELPEPDCAPKKIKILGEDLLAFRDTAGLVGLIDPVCPHRGASLYYGRNEESGIRCVFHGLKFDRHGKCVDIPIASPDTCKEKLSIKSYPTHEAGGYIWVYMGPKEFVPEFPQMEFTTLPNSHVYVSKKWQDCNWAQCLEGAIDTAHFSFLHMVIAKDEKEALAMLQHAAIGAQSEQNSRIRWVKEDSIPKFEILETDVGLTIGGARKADGDDLYWRIAQFMNPNHALVPSAFPGENYHGQTFVPADDHSCWIYTYTWNPDRPLTDEEIARCKIGHTVHAEVDENYIPLRTKHNEYMIDRDLQKTHSFTGITGVSEQDAAIQDSQGSIADRSLEHLFPTDVGVMRFRRHILQAARDLQNKNVEPKATSKPASYKMRSGGWIANSEKKLATVMLERFGQKFGIVEQEQ